MAAYLVPRIREVPPKSSTLTGGIASQYIQFLTKPKAYGQIISVSGSVGGRGRGDAMYTHVRVDGWTGHCG